MSSGTMRVIEIAEAGGPEVLRLARRPVPMPGWRQIRIRVAAAGVNRPDALQRAGLYAPPKGASDLPGLEAAGIVDAIGPGVARWRVGDAVTALLPGGGYAEYALTHEDHALPVPVALGWVEAAALPETLFTVWSNLFMRARLRPGETLLVHGGSSGIGTTAIQLANALGVRVFATAGSEEKCQAIAALGAARAICYREEEFVEIVREATAGRGADVILDMVGGEYVARNLKALAEEGRLVQIAFLQGAKVTANLAGMMMRRQTITGSTLRPQSDLAKARIREEIEARAWPLVENGRLRPVIDSVFPLAEAARAHARMEASAHIGKIVLKLADPPREA